MAPIFHLCNRILLALEIPGFDRLALEEELTRIRRSERDSISLISSACLKGLQGSRFLVVSRSSAITRSLLAMTADRRIETVVMESLPGGEGSIIAKELADGGVRVTLVCDSMVFEEARRCDAGLSGADSIGPGGVLNKIGTRSMAQACIAAGIPCHVLAGESKLLPFAPSEMMRYEATSDDLTRASQVFELTPLGLFDRWFSEQGDLPAMEAARRSGSMAVSPSLLRAKTG
ncbi:MAG: translation initiation factor eIF-2B [Methanomassiliicoccales archaeon]|nr:translation initiation factor eIF-2B [Methanomassiliicoccales archaeon]